MKDAVCRLCLAVVDPDDSGCSVLNDRFRQALEIVFTFKIREAKDLPVHTCQQCSWNVLDFRSYSELVKQNQEALEKGLPLNVQNKSTAGEDTVATGTIFRDDNEENVANDVDTLNSFQLSEEKHPVNAKTTPIDYELAIDDVKVAYENLPDQESSTTVKEVADKLCSDVICEEYVITSSETEENANYTTMETFVEKIILTTRERFVAQSEDDLSGADEPAQKKKKLSSSESTSTRENNMVNDAYNTSSNVHKEAVQVLNEQPNEMHPCERCEKKFASKWQLEYHNQEHMVSKCPFCRITVPAKMLNVHVTIHQDAWSCKKCNKKFLKHRDFTQHRNGCVNYSSDYP